MRQIILVRHGQTDWNLAGRWQGSTDTPLNNYGREQASALALSLEGSHYSVIASSELQRAVSTADILNQILDCPRLIDKRLNEINLGLWEGHVVSEIPQIDPVAWEQWNSGIEASSAPSGESRICLAARTKQALEEICQQHPVGNIMIVSHKISIESLICLAEKKSLSEIGKLSVPNLHPITIEWPE